MLLKRLLLAIAVTALFGAMTKAYGDEQKPEQAITVDLIKGTLVVTPKATTTEPIAAAEAPKPAEPAKPVEEAKPPHKESKVIDFSKDAEAPQEMSSTTGESTAPIAAGEEQRASYVHVQKNSILLDEQNNCVGVIENGTVRMCRYDDVLRQQ